MKVELHIDRLVLTGVSRAEAERVAAGLAGELEARLAGGPLPPALGRAGHLPSLDAGAVSLEGAAKPETAGARLASALHGALKR